MQEAILAIDLGTSACKAVLFGADGSVLAHATIPYPTWRPDAVRAEQHPNDWWNAATLAVRRVAATDERVCVRAIVLSSQRETVLPVDEHGNPVRSAMLWMDGRGLDEIASLRERFGRSIHRWTGLVPSATYSAGKILWMRCHQPELFSATRHYLQPKDFLLYRMSGVLATDVTLASRTMLFNMETHTWQQELLDACGVTEKAFPPVYASDLVVAELRPDVALDWGLPSGIPIVLGGGDRACEVLGSGIQDGEVMESTGTTSNIACSVLAPRFSERVTCSCHVIQGQWILEQGLSTTGAIVDWVRYLLGHDNLQELDAAIDKSSPGAGGLLVLPFFMGARAPRWNPLAEGAIIGLTLAHTREDIVRAVVEGIAYELRFALETYGEMGIPVERIRLVGGGAYMDKWNQIKATVYQKHLAAPRWVHAASFGAYLLAARRLGWITSYGEGQANNPLTAIYHPDLKYVDLYDEGYQLYTQLNHQLEQQWPLLDAHRRRVMTF
ncbi:xylulokinase [Alicyclobacillus contaminans]|uniref:xylulokinase n=1 Tax=Alicyclobacillus contaminans TaxID=392016 RepID=UPI0004081D9E|nr:FGGY family carbohydrate kinase [Alicyclobacillus contaminans]GMA51645.1 xylulokinase [Alicyclobacillus contaminans]